MAHYKMQVQRTMLVNQATLMSSELSAAQVNEFIRSGDLGDRSRANVIPYDADAARAIAESGRLV